MGLVAVFAEMLNAVQIVKEEMILMRTDVSLAATFNSALSTIDDLELTVLHLPRKERLPASLQMFRLKRCIGATTFSFLMQSWAIFLLLDLSSTPATLIRIPSLSKCL